MKSTTKRILTSVMTLVLTVVAVGTTTFAWFTLGTIVNLSGVQGSVRGEDGLEFQMKLGATETEWKTNLTAADWDEIVAAELTDNGENVFRFDAIERDNTGLFTKLFEQNDGSWKQGGATDGAAVVANQNGEYLEFELNFRSEQPGFIHLDDIVFDGPKTAFPTDIAFDSYAKGDDVEFESENALRVTLVGAAEPGITYREIETYTDAEAREGQFAYNTAKGKLIKDNNDDLYVAGVAGQDEVQVMNSLISGVKFNKVNEETYTNGFAIELEQVGGAGLYKATIKVQVWIDGWDPHTYNPIFNLLLGFDLRFKKHTQNYVNP